MELIYYFPPKIRGAPETVAYSVFQQLYEQRSELGFELSVFTTEPGVSKIRSEFEDIKLVSLADIKRSPRLRVVHMPISPMLFPNIRTLFFMKANWNKIPIISNYHGDFRIELMNRYHNQNLFGLLCSAPTAAVTPQILRMNCGLVVNSPSMAQMLQQRYHIEKNVVVIPNGIDDGLFTQKIHPLELNGDPSIFCHGRLSYEKGIDLLLNSISQLKKEDREHLRLYLAGAGPLREKLEDLSKRLGISENIIYTGQLSHAEILQYLKSVDLAIYPSRYESFSLAILEALAVADCPVCMSNCAGICGFLRRGDDLIQFNPEIPNILRLLQSQISGDLFTNGLVQRQKEFAKRFLWSNIVKQYINYYRKIALSL